MSASPVAIIILTLAFDVIDGFHGTANLVSLAT